KPEERKKLPANIVAILEVDAAKRDAKQTKTLADYYAKTDKKLTELTKAVSTHEKTAPKGALAQTLKLGPPRKTHVHIRGDFLRRGVEVHAGTPAVLPPLKAGGQPTRLDLARWIVRPENPLTARVIANWAWHKYFGRGLVPTLEDFGTQGEK